MFPKSAKLALVGVLAALPLTAATQFTYTIQGNPTALRWAPASFPLAVQVDRRVIDELPGGAAALQRAFGAWQGTDADISFQPFAVVDGARAGKDGRNVVALADELFRGQGALALTTYNFDDGGRFTDVDIQIDRSLLTSEYNIQTTVQHEIGHLLGLDHSAVLTSIMYPYVSRGTSAPAFDSDDNISIASSYPAQQAQFRGATLQGRITGDTGGIFAAQVVAMNANGQPVATALTNVAGEFTIEGVPAGRYRLYVEPLDGPVDPNNLSGVYRQAKVNSFPTQFFSEGELTVESGKVYGNIHIAAHGTTKLNPRWIGSSTNGRQDFSLTTAALIVKPGDQFMLAVAGDGFTSGMTQFEILNPAFRRVSEFKWAANYVTASYVVDANAPAGSVVILVRSGNESATLTGALRIMNAGKRRAVR